MLVVPVAQSTHTPVPLDDATATTWDSDGDGRIDAYNITFNTTLTAHEVHPNAFTLGSGTEAVQGIRKSPLSGTHSTYTIFFPPRLGTDTSSTPDLARLDPSGSSTPSTDLGDGARPVIASAHPASDSAPDNKSVLVYMSEPVATSGTCDGIDEAGFIDYTGDTVASVSFNETDKRQIMITLDSGWSSGDAVRVNASVGSCLLGEDGGTDPLLVASTAPYPVDLPTIEAVQAEAANNAARIRFSTPVHNGSGGALTGSDFSITGDSIEIDDLIHEVDSASATVAFNRSLTIDDMVSLALSPESVHATGSDFQITADASFQDLSPPRITAAESRSLDALGVRQAVRLTFSEPVNGSLDVSDWTVTNETGQTGALTAVEVVSGSSDAYTAIDLVLSAPTTPGPGSSAPIQGFNYGGTSIEDLAGNALPDDIAGFSARDVVPPSLIAAHTLDMDQDGLIDAYNLTFSEPVDPSTFETSAWSVQDTSVTGFSPWDNGGVGAELHFDEQDHLQTDAIPALAVAADGIQDHAGNPLSAADSGQSTPQVRDGAPPVVLGVTGSGDNVTLRFSEPIDAAAQAEGLDADAFGYDDVATGGASAIASVNHTEGSATVAIRLDDPLAPGDIGNDTIQVEPGAVLESDSGNLLDAPQEALTTPVPIVASTPGEIVGLAVDPASLETDRATVTWTAPGATGGNDGIVAGYEVKISDGPFNGTESGFMAATDAQVLFWPDALAPPGQVQGANITGLDRDTEYHLRVRAINDLGVKGPISAPATFTTAADDTPPTGQLVINSSTHAEPSIATTADFAWSGLSDPESDILYRYTVDDTPETNVTAGAQSTTSPSLRIMDLDGGIHYLHVRGESQGGATNTSHHRFEVIPTLSDAAMQAANDLLNYNVTRENGTNIITWELPPREALLEDVIGLQIWRSNSPYELVAFIQNGTPAMENSTYVDDDPDATADSGYLLQLVFRGNQSLFSGTDGEAPDETQTGQIAHQTSGDKESLLDLDGLWIWGMGILAVLLVATMAVGFIRKARQNQDAPDGADQSGSPAQEGDSFQGIPEGGWEDPWLSTAESKQRPDPEPKLTLECPLCYHRFKIDDQASNEIDCPSCGGAGTMPESAMPGPSA